MRSTIQLTVVLIFFALLSCTSSKDPGQITFVEINQQVKNFPDEYDLGTPVKSFITLNYAQVNGRIGMLKGISQNRHRYSFPPEDTPDVDVSEEGKLWFLNTTLREVAIYKDSIAIVISQTSDSAIYGRYFALEYDNWVNSGEDIFASIQNGRDHFREGSDDLLKNLRREYDLSREPQDISVFINFLEHNAHEPVSFVMDKLSKHKITMFGEVHFRKISWDFCRSLLIEKEFAAYVGTVFLEFASHMQNDIDLFMKKDTLDTELLLGVFREYILGGWTDKGRYDFVVDLWNLNKTLPENKKVKVVLVDTPRPFSTFTTREDISINDSKYNRDEYMASTISEYLVDSNDDRNTLFIVGTAHICKSLNSAGKILMDSLLRDDIYSIFTHSPRMDNWVDIPERLRLEVFDQAFHSYGDKPMAFNLDESPFGKEPFDGLYYDGSGSYQQNYDGYIFFGSLDNEPYGEILFDIFDDAYIKETERLYNLQGWNLKRDWDIEVLNLESIIESLLKDYTEKRWENILSPLEIGPIANKDYTQ
jgi:hypothetical protein